ncbi:BTAD domain-containing putative transcriptional regulator [Actinoallomurus sp. NPDC052274]|uniref:AfsR/SARP family transcriptional regulator n=1 Tax=Actinoallomurus sp. NPDC052274 TaxID=3155420 RepID=UPI003426CE13
MRQVLAFLLLRSGKFVQVGEFIDELWGDTPPSSAMTTLQTYIYKLRKDVLERCPGAHLHTRVSGYVLEVPPQEGDVFEFERLAAEGRAALDSGDAAGAADALSQALALWRGPAALADVTVGEILSAYVTRMEEERLRVLELRIEADLRLGRHLALISELKVLVSRHPLHERFYANLMLALHRSGRRYEALEVYQRLRRVLVDELGLEPPQWVQRLHLALLSSDPTVESLQEVPIVARSPDRLMVPAQLPPDIPDFVGRDDVLEQVRESLISSAHGGTAASAVSISGMPGVGKTAVALRAAHLERSAFPDGQLYADLRGSTDDPADPREVLAEFARAIGIPHHQVPESQAERSKLFRTWSTGRRVLVVLDDAASVQQVVPLLPATPHCAVIITNRGGLHGLPGVRHIGLGALDPDAGMSLLKPIVGADRVEAERDAAERIYELCGGLPLALRSVGSRLAAASTWPLAKMVAQLEDGRRRLDELSFADLDVRARYDASYRRLSPCDRSAFRLISLLPPPDFSAATAAGLIGSGTDVVEMQLIRLVGCHLLEIAKTGNGGEIRYALPELTRLYARERLDMEFVETAGDRRPEPAGEGVTDVHDPPAPYGAPAVPLSGAVLRRPGVRPQPPGQIGLRRPSRDGLLHAQVQLEL